jgi:mycothiol synthase
VTTINDRTGAGLPGPVRSREPLVRPYRGPEDHPILARIGSAARTANGDPELVTTAQLDNDYAHLSNCDLPRDCMVVELGGRGVAYGRTYWVDRNSGERSFEAVIFVDPSAPGQGVEAALLGWEIDHLVELAAANPPDPVGRPALLAAYTTGRDHASRALLERAGFANVRRSASLVRADLAAIPDLPLPDGFELRPIDPTDRVIHRRIFDAAVLAFADHWGDSESDGSESSFQAFVGDPNVRPDLWRVAFHADQIAGQILNFLESGQEEGTVTGWTESISVQPRFRRRGLARALLAESLRTVRDAGATRAALGVDTGNVRRALDLYESLGFRIVSESYEYQRAVPAPDGHPGAAR